MNKNTLFPVPFQTPMETILLKTRSRKSRRYFCLVFLIFLMTIILPVCKKEKERFVIIAHRGASYVAPENTLIAFKKAMETGVHYSELDVHQTKDGEIILMHDETLDRTTDETGEVWNFSLDVIKQLDAGVWFGEQFRGEPVPTLREVIKFVKGKMKLNIEVKISRDEPEIVRKVVDIILSEKFVNKCIITSFDRLTIEAFKETAPDIKTGFLFYKEYPEDIFVGNWDVLCAYFEVVNKDFVFNVRENGKKIYVWTVNEKEEMRRLLDLEVDGIITDRPELLQEVLVERTAKKD